MRASGARGKAIANVGTLSFAGAVPMTVGDNPRSVIVSPDGKGVYVTLYDQAKVAQYNRGTDGKLTALATRDFATTNANPAYMTFNSAGTILYVTHPGNDYLKPLLRNTTTNVLTSIPGTLLTTSTQAGIALSPDDNFGYVACRNTDTGMARVIMFSKSNGSAAAAVLSPAAVDIGTAAGSIAVVTTRTDNGLNVYVANFANHLVHLFRRDVTTGQLTANVNQASVLPPGTVPKTCWMAIDHQDKHLYVVLDNIAQVACYSIAATTGVLTFVGVYATGNGPFSIVMSSDSTRVYIGDSDGQTIRQYYRDTTSGVLTAMVPAFVRSCPYTTAITGSNGPQTLALSPDGNDLYCTNSKSPGSIGHFKIKK